MRFTSFAAMGALAASLATALPTDLTHFFLVTSDQSDPSSNSSQLRGVHATTPYVRASPSPRFRPPNTFSYIYINTYILTLTLQAEDPVSQSSLLLRLIGPGYNSLPNFTLTDGVLSTTTAGPHGIGSVQYNSSAVVAGQELQFAAKTQGRGNVGLNEGYLVTVDGESKGWTICDSDSGTDVLWWKGEGSDCKATYLQAVGKPPYRRV